MSERKLYVKIHLFDLNQIIYSYDDNKIQKLASVPMDAIPSLIPTLCDSNGIEKVEVDGVLPVATKLANDIKEYTLKNFTNNIEVEVVKK